MFSISASACFTAGSLPSSSAMSLHATPFFSAVLISVRLAMGFMIPSYRTLLEMAASTTLDRRSSPAQSGLTLSSAVPALPEAPPITERRATRRPLRRDAATSAPSVALVDVAKEITAVIVTGREDVLGRPRASRMPVHAHAISPTSKFSDRISTNHVRPHEKSRRFRTQETGPKPARRREEALRKPTTKEGINSEPVARGRVASASAR